MKNKMTQGPLPASVVGIFFIAILISSGCAKNCPEVTSPKVESEAPAESAASGGSSAASLPLGYTKTLDGITEIDQAVAKVTDALVEQGFSIVSDMDVQKTIKEKLDETMAPYRILGACNPKLAFEAIQKDPTIGMLLPCKVIIYQNEQGELVVSFAKPLNVVTLAGNPELKSVAVEADKAIKGAFDSL